mmetsp:Transcript_14236/g.35525  ORF Transcript_14236/g.35525 Transcript_14236/m.35525 type:complete len:226 (+) Transcript_14236:152-829(+)
MQSVARPFFAPSRCIWCTSVTRTRAPDAPIGWPSAIAPPQTFTRAASSRSCWQTARLCAAKASFASTRSRSSTRHPALARHLRTAGTGPIPITRGSTPALAAATIRARTGVPVEAAYSSEATRSAAAPSFSPDALPAVTLPSFWKAGRSFASLSAVTPGLGYSSRAKSSGSPFFCGTGTATISRSNQPAAIAASARCCDAAAYSSCASRESEYCCAMFSAVMPMW